MTTIMWGIPVMTCLKWSNHTLHVYKFSSFNYPGNKTVAYYVWKKICSAQTLLEEQALAHSTLTESYDKSLPYKSQKHVLYILMQNKLKHATNLKIIQWIQDSANVSSVFSSEPAFWLAEQFRLPKVLMERKHKAFHKTFHWRPANGNLCHTEQITFLQENITWLNSSLEMCLELSVSVDLAPVFLYYINNYLPVSF